MDDPQQEIYDLSDSLKNEIEAMATTPGHGRIIDYARQREDDSWDIERDMERARNDPTSPYRPYIMKRQKSRYRAPEEPGRYHTSREELVDEAGWKDPRWGDNPIWRIGGYVGTQMLDYATKSPTLRPWLEAGLGKITNADFTIDPWGALSEPPRGMSLEDIEYQEAHKKRLQKMKEEDDIIRSRNDLFNANEWDRDLRRELKKKTAVYNGGSYTKWRRLSKRRRLKKCRNFVRGRNRGIWKRKKRRSYWYY